MIVAVHQPNYIPYLGFFSKMAIADVLVLYDTAQFSKNEFHNRNRIKSPRGPVWLTVPVRKPGFRPIRDVEIDVSTPWSARHWKATVANYVRAKHFEDYAPNLERLLKNRWERLAVLNESLISQMASWLNLETRVIRSSDLKIPSGLSPSEKLVEFTKRAGGTAYLSGAGGPTYLESSVFKDVELLLHDFRHPEYLQLWGPFIPNMCALDLLLNVGSRAADIVKSAGRAVPWPC